VGPTQDRSLRGKNSGGPVDTRKKKGKTLSLGGRRNTGEASEKKKDKTGGKGGVYKAGRGKIISPRP